MRSIPQYDILEERIMATKMNIAELDLVEAGTPDSQKVAVLDEPGLMGLRHAAIPVAGHGEIRVKSATLVFAART